MNDKAEVTPWQELVVLIRTRGVEFFNFLISSNKTLIGSSNILAFSVLPSAFARQRRTTPTGGSRWTVVAGPARAEFIRPPAWRASRTRGA